jgi:hypothetical protein
MRDPKRIAIVLDALRKVWEQQPDLRLGQLLVIGVRPMEPCPELFNIEDQPLLEGLLRYQAQINGSRSESEQVEVSLGSESDSLLLGRLQKTVHAAGGTMSEVSWGVGGSQEITTYEIVLPTGSLIATAETYVGLSIRGPDHLVQEVSRAVLNA